MNKNRMLTILFSLIYFMTATCFPTFYFESSADAVTTNQTKSQILTKVKKLQIPFIENIGQVRNKDVKYYAKTYVGTVFITKDRQMIYSIPKLGEDNNLNYLAIKEAFVGASVTDIKGEYASTTKVNYFKGKDPSHWRTNISTYNILNLGELYKGIELKLKAYGDNIEKLFYVKPNAKAENIKVKIEGSRGLIVNGDGELEIETNQGLVKFTKPVAYQENDGKHDVEVSYRVKGNEYGFKVGDYDKTKGLVIDPLLASTFLGGTDEDRITSISIDTNGNIYVAGNTASSNFPVTSGTWDTTYNGDSGWMGDVFISKLDGNLQNLLTCTFLGGVDGEDVTCISTDNSGNVYVTGQTNSTDFPQL